MEKEFYIHYAKINARIAETVTTGYHIVVDGETYEKVSRRPAGKRLVRKLRNTQNNLQLSLYA